MAEDMDAILDAAFRKVLGYVPSGANAARQPHQKQTYDHAAILRMATDGVPYKVIADNLGCAEVTVNRVCRQAGYWRKRRHSHA